MSLTADRRGGFDDDDTGLIHATLPGLSLAMKAAAGYVIASSLLRTYLGEEPGRRVHAGAIERGSVESINAVLWYADIRGFTPASETSPGPVIIDLLNTVFEALTAALRTRGGEVPNFSATHARNLIVCRGGSRRDMPARTRRRGGSDAVARSA